MNTVCAREIQARLIEIWSNAEMGAERFDICDSLGTSEEPPREPNLDIDLGFALWESSYDV
jgi:hypothetical protein